MWKSGKVWKFWKNLKFGKINGSLEKFWKFGKILEILKNFGNFENIQIFRNIWKLFGNLDDRKFVKRNLEIIQKFGKHLEC